MSPRWRWNWGSAGRSCTGLKGEALGIKPAPRSEAWLREKADERQRRRIEELERLVARQALEPGFFQRCLAAHRGKSPEAGEAFRQAVYEQIRHVDGQQGRTDYRTDVHTGGCKSRQLLSLRRARGPTSTKKSRGSATPFSGWRSKAASTVIARVTHALRAQGWEVNHKAHCASDARGRTARHSQTPFRPADNEQQARFRGGRSMLLAG